MPILAIRNRDDVERLRRAVTSQYEEDLLETLIAWRWRYDDAMKLIEYTAKTCLEDSRGLELPMLGMNAIEKLRAGEQK